MIVEYTYSEYDLRKKCYGCAWLKMRENDNWFGYCECLHNKVKNRDREVTDRACICKVRSK